MISATKLCPPATPTLTARTTGPALASRRGRPAPRCACLGLQRLRPTPPASKPRSTRSGRCSSASRITPTSQRRKTPLAFLLQALWLRMANYGTTVPTHSAVSVVKPTGPFLLQLDSQLQLKLLLELNIGLGIQPTRWSARPTNATPQRLSTAARLSRTLPATACRRCLRARQPAVAPATCQQALPLRLHNWWGHRLQAHSTLPAPYSRST